MTEKSWVSANKSWVLADIGMLVSNAPLVEKRRLGQRLSGLTLQDLGILEGAWLALDDAGKVLDLGTGEVPERWMFATRVSARGKLVFPGFVDSHTHPLFAGVRAGEFAARLDGATYQEIGARGGGIQLSISASRQESDEGLRKLASQRFAQFLRHGVTTVEAKTGYGQSVAEELRHLRLLNELKAQIPQELVITCLALHAIPKEFPNAQSYVDVCIQQLLPAVAKENLASYVDMFIEQGYFSVADCEPFAEKAQELGLGIRVHAEEFSDTQSSAFAARWRAASADHLQYASSESLRLMAENGVVATLLPGTSLYTAIPFADGEKMREAGCEIAIASDFNPGSCALWNLPQLGILAGLHGHLKRAEIVAGLTYIPAKSLGLDHRKGALAQGFDGDFVIYPFAGLDDWLADCGQTQPESVWIKGARVF